MATAEKTTVQVTKDVPAVTLTLDEDEAKILVALLNKTAGAPKDSNREWAPRGHLTDKPGNVLSALRAQVGDWHFESMVGDGASVTKRLAGPYLPGDTLVVKDVW